MHSIEELFSVAVDGDDEDRWAAVQRLRTIAGDEVLGRSLDLCRSDDPRARATGAEILGQLPGARQALPVLEQLMADESTDVVAASILALSQQLGPESVDVIASCAAHADPKVRWATVTALEAFVTDEGVVRLLIGLMRDEEPDVRDRATFAVGSLSEADTPRLRSALVERLQDESESVAREAALGLARRHDARAILFIAKAVEGSDDEIAEAVDEITVPAMLHDLVKVKREGGGGRGVDSLIARCRARL